MRTLRRRAMMTGYRKLEYIAGKEIVGKNTPLGIKTSPDMSIVMKYARQNKECATLLNTNTGFEKLFNIGTSPDSYVYHNKDVVINSISTTEEPIVVRVKSMSEGEHLVLKDGVYEFSVNYNLENTLWLGGIKEINLWSYGTLLYYLQIDDGKGTKLDLFPIQTSTGKVGMLDKISGKFFDCSSWATAGPYL